MRTAREAAAAGVSRETLSAAAPALPHLLADDLGYRRVVDVGDAGEEMVLDLPGGGEKMLVAGMRYGVHQYAVAQPPPPPCRTW